MDSEVEALEQVLLWWPPDSLGRIDDPRAWMMRRRVDLLLMRRQCEGLVRAYEEAGVEVLLVEQPAPPNIVFCRDLFTVGPRGAWLANMAFAPRRDEVALAAPHLPGPTLPPPARSFEGADLLWATPQDLLLGLGNRTHATDFLGAPTLHPLQVPPGVQHLLGVVTFFDRGRAAVRTELLDPAPLRALGVEILEIPESDEVRDGRGMNFVALAPGRVLMPADCPVVQGLLEALGVSCEPLDVSEYLAADGGIGCATGILMRSSAQVAEAVTD